MTSSKRVRTAFILAGGKGIRMRRLGQYLPKCALVIYDQPLLIRQVESLRKVGVTDVVISIGEQYEGLVRSVIRPLEAQVNLEVVVDRKLTGPVDALISVADRFEGQRHFFLLSDIYLEDEDFFQTGATTGEGSLLLSTQSQPRPEFISAGCNVVVEHGRVVRILEKPKPQEIVGNICWTGFSVHPSSFFETAHKVLRSDPPASFTHIGQLYDAMLKVGMEVRPCTEKGAVVNVTTPDDLLVVNALELRKIRKLRTDEKRSTWESLKAILNE